MTDLPPNAVAYKMTTPFTPKTLPAKFKAMHRTKAGVWGRIDVLYGCLTLSRFEPDGAPLRDKILKGGEFAVLKPMEPHAVAFECDGAFTVTFFKESPLTLDA